MRVMIVEDDRAIRERFAHAMAPHATFIEQAQTARQAIARLAIAQPDVLLVDLGLPDLHGTEVIRQAARALPKCDIMVITVFADGRSVLESIEAGACGYILKDCSDAELVANVAQLRAGGAPMSPGIARIVLSRLRKPPRCEDAGLSPREVDVLNMLSRGYGYAEVGERLGISLHTVSSHIKNMYRKLAVHSAAAAVARAAELKVLRPGSEG
ncbi:MAG TPA: response regulator transcription factor [Burkholderiales bacterium]|nr:response regulator transcription factor [Burkholderiales bacterium]